MKIKIEEHIITLLDEDGKTENITTIRTPIIIPDENKVLRNKVTGDIINGIVGVGTNDSVDNYEEIDKDNGAIYLGTEDSISNYEDIELENNENN